MKKRKVSVIAVAILTCIVCLSMIAGATFALFTDNDSVNVSVTTAKLNVSADIDTVGTGSNGTTENTRLSATYDKDTKTLSVVNMLPGDVVTFKVNVKSSATVDVKYRLSFGSKDESNALFDELLLGVKDTAEAENYDYYISSVSAWETIYYNTDETKMVESKYVALELPAYVSAKSLENQTCNIEFAVEAVQDNASGTQYESEAKAVRAYRVTEGSAIDGIVSAETFNDKDVIVLDGENGNDWSIVTDAAKEFYVKGCDVKTLTVDAPNATIHYQVNYTNKVDVVRSAPLSFHVYGTVAEELVVKEGRAVVEAGAKVAAATVQPEAEKAATIVTNEAVKTLTVAGAGVANVEVAKEVVVEKLEVTNTNDETTIVNDGTIEEVGVTTKEAFATAVALGGEVTLGANIELDKAVTFKKDVDINLNKNTLTITANSTPITINTVSVSISDGDLILNVTSGSSSAYAIRMSGSLNMANVDYEANLISTRTSSSQTLYAINNNGELTLTESNVSAAVVSKTNEKCVVTLYAIMISGGYNGNATAVIDGGSLTGTFGVYFGNANASVTIGKANIDYTTNGIYLKTGGSVVLKSGVTFSGALENFAIVTNLTNKDGSLDDSESGYDWQLERVLSDCSGYDPVSNIYAVGDVKKQVFTENYPEHTYDKPVFDYDWNWYVRTCSVCGATDTLQAGETEELYYPVKEGSELVNAVLNGKFIKLENDITINSLYQNFKDDCSFDLNGHTITVKNNVGFEVLGKNVTIKNGSIVRPQGVDYSYAIKVTGVNVTLDGIKTDAGINVSGYYNGGFLTGCSVTVKNCEITLNGAQAYYAVCAQGMAVATVENTKVVRTAAGKANNYFWVQKAGLDENQLNVPEASKLTVKNCTFESTCNTTMYNKGGVAPVFEDSTVKVDTATELKNMLADCENVTIILDADISATESFVVNKNVTLDLNGHTITSSATAFELSGTANLTVLNGKVNMENTGGRTFNMVGEAALTLNSVDIESKNFGIVSTASGKVTIDGGNFNIASFGIYLIPGALSYSYDQNPVYRMQLEVKDLVINIKGTVAFWLVATDAKLTNTEVIVDNASTASACVFTLGGTEIVLTECKLTNLTGSGLMGNGNPLGKANCGLDTVITLNDCTVIGGECALYLPQIDSDVTVNGGTYTASIKSAIEIRAGKLTLNGATLVCTAEEFSAGPNGNGSTIIGAALAVSQHTTNDDIVVVVNNTTLTGIYALYEKDLQDGINKPPVQITLGEGNTLNGGVFSQNCDNIV